LEVARHGRPAVVVFYRGAWCPYCNLALRTYEVALAPTLSQRDIALIAVSPQRPDGSLSTREINQLSYIVVSDPGNHLAEQLGILSAPTDDVRRARILTGLNVASANADGTDNVPKPTVVLVDASGTIRWIDVRPNYALRSEPLRILNAVENLYRNTGITCDEEVNRAGNIGDQTL
jgi:peroxiredoxin